MRKISIVLFILVPMLISCREDEDKITQTDLPTEASQLFSVSEVWGESLYYAMISWEEYQQADSLGLPGCPEVLLDELNRQVILEFSPDSSCTNPEVQNRLGKLLIRFDQNDSSDVKSWSMEYEDYIFGLNSIQGKRDFFTMDSITVSEKFQGLTQVSDGNLTTVFNGTLTHKRSYSLDTLKRSDTLATGDSSNSIDTLVNLSLSKIFSLGAIDGINPAGRSFDMVLTPAQAHEVGCYQRNQIHPKTGGETWRVSRGISTGVNYSLTYEVQSDSCAVLATVTLPDGKKLLLNSPSE